MTSIDYAHTGGTIDPTRHVYVEREADHTLYEALHRKRSLALIAAPRQSGKTSLIRHTEDKLKDQRWCYLDLREVIGPVDETNNTARAWYGRLLRAITRRLDIDLQAFHDWHKTTWNDTYVQLTVRFIEQFVREHVSGPLNLVIDEIDLLELFGGHTDYAFEAFRLLFPRLDALDTSIVLLGLSHPNRLLKVGRIAFNVGLPITLPHFEISDETVAAWSQGLPLPEAERQSVTQAVLEQTAGQPFLTSYLLNQIREKQIRTAIAATTHCIAVTDEARSGDVLQGHFGSIEDILFDNTNWAYPAVQALKALQNGPIAEAKVEKRAILALRTAGLVRTTGNQVTLISPIYRRYFDRQWLKHADIRLAHTTAPVRFAKSALLTRGPRERICVINTGGTVGMELQPDGTMGTPNDLNIFFQNHPELYEIADIEPVPLVCKDGSNMFPEDWVDIADAIFRRRNAGFKGFVVAHGTDTMAYTASAVAFALGPELDFPVIFTGSQAPQHVVHGDAKSNLVRACRVATKPIPEVGIQYDDQCFRAVRAQKIDDYRFRGFASPTHGPLAIVAEEIEVQPQSIRAVDKTRRLEIKPRFETGIFKLQFYPGLKPEFLGALLDRDDIVGYIIETPGIGNIPTIDSYSIVPFIERATAENKPVLITSQYPIRSELAAQYRPAKAPLDAGAIPAGNMAGPAAQVKFMWVLGQLRDSEESGQLTPEDRIAEVRQSMRRDYVGEVDLSISEKQTADGDS